jgi:two-component system phosphate regulon sensor histidine kinase PhoR
VSSASLPWIISGVLLLAAIGLFALWRRASSAKTGAALAADRAEREAREVRAAARRDAAYLAALSSAHPEPVLILAPDRTILHLNPAASALFARPEHTTRAGGPRPAPGQTLIVATRSVELDELAAHTLAGGEDRDRQVTVYGQPYRARAVRANDAASGDLGMVLVLQDLSEVQRLGRARRDFIANISHELRTPLTSIHLLLDNLLSGAAREPDELNALLHKVGAEVRVLEQMAQELLDLAQIESGQALVRLVPKSVADLVAEVVERFAPQAEHKQHLVTVDMPPDLTVLADAQQVSRALGNLLHNAIKFTPPGGRITVRAGRLDGDVLIEVADTGPGIPPEDLPRVFERFYRGDRSRAGGGTGLGLAVAKHVVEAHGGRIWVESEGRPGHGAVFRFTLLAAEEKQAR